MVEREHITKIEQLCRAFLKGELTVLAFADDFHVCFTDEIRYQPHNAVYARMDLFHDDYHRLESEQLGWRGKMYAKDNRRMRALTGDFLKELQQLSASQPEDDDSQRALPPHTAIALMVERGHIQKIEDLCRSFLGDELMVEEFKRRFYGYYWDLGQLSRDNDVGDRMKRFQLECSRLQVTQFDWSGYAYASDNRRIRSMTRTFLEDLKRLVRTEAAQ